ncbi:ATP-binding cassette domain-containing protein [Planomonospora sp. ID67723]|uniref:ABC transporter ATP-binding protein n=1 Tax=Planomonospora sp. ID67723 TaxID=2738134 RepID=UPI0018C3DE65|nr:ATP-binding cassette domain-containing protein [Planomonospora sp. ID67723]MBG0828166.1 ATP-binding cassette domain-containing protein [Planomonospora sp. ID67723]
MPEGVPLHARDLSLRSERGWVYRDVDLDMDPGDLVAVAGETGSGRTSLLLTLAGRMKPTGGTLTVAGHTGPRAIRRVAALGLIDGVNDLERALTVREHVHERVRGLFWNAGSARRAGAAMERAGLELSPEDRTLIRDLGREQRVRLGIALALLDEPGLLVLDNVDAGLAADRRDALWATLGDLAGQGLTVVASCTESPLLRTVHLTVPDGPSAEEPPAEESAPEEPAVPVDLLWLAGRDDPVRAGASPDRQDEDPGPGDDDTDRAEPDGDAETDGTGPDGGGDGPPATAVGAGERQEEER